MKKKKLVYIASPYTKGDVAVNIRDSLLVADELVKRGFLPYAPLLSHFWHLIYPHPYEYWMTIDFNYILCCDCVLRLGGESDGADREVSFAETYGIPVYYSIEDIHN